MASPQVEEGFTQIANEILERLALCHLPPNYWRVLLVIIRKTYGYQKKVDYIANCQIVESTGLGKEVVSRALKHLEEWNIVTRSGRNIGFQKDWERWDLLAESSTKVSRTANKPKLAEQLTKLAESSTKVSSHIVTQKKERNTLSNSTKESIKKKYGEFSNVLLTDEEHSKLSARFGQSLVRMIENLSTGIESRGYKYKSHYATLLNWALRDEKEKVNVRTSTNIPARNQLLSSAEIAAENARFIRENSRV